MKKVFAMMLLCIICSNIYAQSVWNGSQNVEFLSSGGGEIDDPYLLNTAEDLAGLAKLVNEGNDFSGKYFKLTSDIYLNDASTPDSTKLKWTRIGGIKREQVDEEFNFEDFPFSGHFDGGGHTIYGLYNATMPEDETGWDDPFTEFFVSFEDWEKGMFGLVRNATIKNLKIKDMVLSGGYTMGGLTPYCENSTITDCHIENSVVKSSLGDYGGGAGGLAGQVKNSVIERCTVDARVQGTRGVGVLAGNSDSTSIIRDCSTSGFSYMTQYFGGGFIGVNLGLIERCSSSADAARRMYSYALGDGGIPDCAAFVGENQGGIIRDCYATGNIVNTELYGFGFCGTNSGLLENCYATGNVSGSSISLSSPFLGQNGFVGKWGDPDQKGDVINCFGTGTCIHTDDYGHTSGFVNNSWADGISLIANCYFNVDNMPNVQTKTEGEFDVTTEFMKSKEFVDELNMMSALLGLTQWQYNEGGYPTLTTEKATNITDYFEGGSGTKDDPWRIANKEQLKNLASFTNHGYHFAGNYILQTADIALNAPFEMWGEEMPELWEPIGKPVIGHLDGAEHTFNYCFRGNYDGGMHEVQNLYANSLTHGTGFFGRLFHDAKIRNLGVTGAWVKGAGKSAILVAIADRYAVNTEIRQCWTSGTVDAINAPAAGIVGDMPLEGDMHLYNCYSTAEVLGNHESKLIALLDVLDHNSATNIIYNHKLENWDKLELLHVQNYFVNRDSVTKALFDEILPPDYAKTTEYLQSSDIVNRMNGFVSQYNATHADDPLLYWKVNEGDYPTFTTDIPPHTINFISNGGSEVASLRVYDNTKTIAPPLPTKEGHIFYGWFKDAELTQFFKFGDTPITEDVTLYAKWQEELVADYSIFNNPFAKSYVIRTPQQLLAFAHAITGVEGKIDRKDFTGMTVKLGADITLNDTVAWREFGSEAYGRLWEPLAQGAYNQFRGTFDGQGYSINGIYCVRNNMDTKQWGFFSWIGVNGVVKNLKLQAAYFENMEQTEVVGGIAGYNLGRIENCHVETRIKVRNCFTGLLAGMTRVDDANTFSEWDLVVGDMIDCSVKGEILNIDYPNIAWKVEANTGGLIGYYDAAGSISNCHVDANIKGVTRTGGLIGMTSSYNRTLTSHIDSCSVKGSIEGLWWVGGFVGQAMSNTDCTNSTADVDITAYGNWVGGLFGFTEGPTYGDKGVNISNCKVSGSIKTTGEHVGGLIGTSSNSDNDTIINCVSTASVVGSNYVGGIIGLADGYHIINSASYGNVTASGEYAGGITGANGVVESCYSLADIKAEKYAGGLSGCIYNMDKSYFAGTITAPNNIAEVGGLVGNDYTPTSSYFDSDKANVNGENGCTTAKMQSVSNYTGWDFAKTWAITPDYNDGYPYLRCLAPEEYKNVAIFTLNTDSAKMHVADELQLTANVLHPEYTTVEWRSSDTSVLTVDNGKVTAVGEGEAYVEVFTPDGQKVSVHIKVTAIAYTVTYMVDGVEYKTLSLFPGETIPVESAPAKEGYTFSGWTEIPETMPAQDVVITGSFTINTYKLTYMVDDEVYKEVEVTFGATITTEAEPAKEGYTFSGWSEIPETMPANDVIITGSFSKINSITGIDAETEVNVYDLNGKLVATKIAFKELKYILEKGVYIINGEKHLIK